MLTRGQRCLALLGTIAALAAGGQAAADPRATLAVQQELRADLLAAMSDGELDHREKRRLDQDASERLGPEAIGAFRKVLGRMAAGSTVPAVASRKRQPARWLRSAVHTVTAEPALALGKQRAASAGEGPEFPGLQTEMEGLETVSEIEAAFDEPSNGAETTAYRTAPIEAPDSPLVASTSAPADRVLEDAPVLEDPGEAVYEDMGVTQACMAVGMGCLDWIQFSTTVDAFQGPMDLDGLNANYGVRFAVNGALPISRRFGLGAQAGTSGVVADFYGTQFTGSRVRSQNFTTVGIFQRLCLGPKALKYGFAFDWLFDEYYASFTMSQWRVKLAWEVSPLAEIGLWSTIPNDGDHALLGAGTEHPTLDAFKPFAQGSLYWRRCWANGTTTTAWIGIAEEPGEWVFGGDARIPMGPRLAFVGNVHYIAPSAEGIPAQEEEVWNVSLGLEWTPGACTNRCRVGKFRPLFRLADNGMFAVRRY